MKDDKRLKRKVRNSYIISTLSIALVLFLLGSVGYLAAVAMKVARSVQESVTVTVELAPTADSVRRSAVEAALRADELTREVTFLAKEEKLADADFRRMFGADIEEVLEENPLRDSYEARLSRESADSLRLAAYLSRVERLDGVAHVSCPVETVERMHATLSKIRLVLLLFGGALLVISLILLNNTIRLAIYSRRYLINTMKLVGATKWFIMRPFLGSSLWQGLWAGLAASALFAAAVFGLNRALPELTSPATVQRAGIIAGCMVAGGILISMLFTATALNKFINLRSDKIHLY